MNNEKMEMLVDNLSEQINDIFEFLREMQNDADCVYTFLDNINASLERVAGNDFDDYACKAYRTIKANATTKDLLLEGALGLSGETGEVVDIIKKDVYHGHSLVNESGKFVIDQLDRDKLIHELGDVLWYVNEIAWAIGAPLSEIANKNIEKLKNRYPEGFSSEASKNRTC